MRHRSLQNGSAEDSFESKSVLQFGQRIGLNRKLVRLRTEHGRGPAGNYYSLDFSALDFFSVLLLFSVDFSFDFSIDFLSFSAAFLYDSLR